VILGFNLKKNFGFSLIELMVVVTVLAILSSIALPIYRDYILQARRSEARAALEEIRNLQHEFFQNYKRFASRTELGYSNTTEHAYYQINISPNTLRYSATATAIGNQSDDRDCAQFSYTSIGALIAYDSASNLNSDCW
jgi:type IV pilus assembly protein PilE